MIFKNLISKKKHIYIIKIILIYAINVTQLNINNKIVHTCTIIQIFLNLFTKIINQKFQLKE